MEGSVSAQHAGEQIAGDLTEAEIDLLLSYLLSHKKAFTQEFLRARDLYFSGTKERLQERLQEYLADGRLQPLDLVKLLNTVEGWGNQHVYLYRAADRLIEGWQDEESVRGHLEGLGMADLLNRQRPLVLPEEPALSSIEWTPERVRFVWIEKRMWEERAVAQDVEQEDMVWRAYRINVSRGLVAFDWDLVSGDGMLLIQRLPRGTQYRAIRTRFEQELDPIVSLSQFERVRISPAIQRVEASQEVRRRQLAYQTPRGGKVRLTSAGQLADTSTDPDLERAEQVLRGETASLLGNFYWLSVPHKLRGELHTKFYASDQGIGIFGEHDERDVRYVLSRIRRYCG